MENLYFDEFWSLGGLWPFQAAETYLWDVVSFFLFIFVLLLQGDFRFLADLFQKRWVSEKGHGVAFVCHCDESDSDDCNSLEFDF